jgi:hypothetical protein
MVAGFEPCAEGLSPDGLTNTGRYDSAKDRCRFAARFGMPSVILERTDEARSGAATAGRRDPGC